MISLSGIEKTYRVRGKALSESVHALRGVDLEIPEGSAISIIGESGCGKSTLGRILAGIEQPTAGTFAVNGENIDSFNAKHRRDFFRGVQLIHQDPYSALNPVRTIYDILIDVLHLHARIADKDADWPQRRLLEILNLVGLDPEYVLPRYPHQLSGGMRQRIVIARALAVDPKVLVADEAVSMIDVSLRLGVLRLLRTLRSELGISVVFITHDLASARYIGQDSTVVVLYRGSIVERGPSDTVVSQAPLHPYTQALLSAIPVLRGLESKAPVQVVPTGILDERNDDTGCLFAPRCPFAQPVCFTGRPPLAVPGKDSGFGAADHEVACLFPQIRQVVPLRSDVAADSGKEAVA
ncbi:ABC transporter ATP-binding protein [Bifidobacterium sp.]|jgi:oligopeptide/dipeptide ABC transporter ATP-binding protein|uniref:ABC transporter ATP-binding protein n=1 Tax=Bifidobacterium sp. TaxID=41200 RepID=UPI0025C29EFA|nr:ABC transporter ATP-binding protein [Bifidobacterium sp.]MCH4209338.1 ABC transporter ATP-binding protein [Bifidobacterium sp.]MCI1224132.1 ABC transporter ATP-binding protein [Bifidobacterium sp.]